MNNQKGLTLIELLAAISIFFVISSLIYGVLFGINKNYDHLSRKTNLNQEANIILTTIKKHHEQDDTYFISYDSSTKKAGIGKDAAATPLHNQNLKIDIELDGAALSGSRLIHSSSPLNIFLKLTDKSGQTYEVDTIIKRY